MPVALDPDGAAIEVKALLRRLHPRAGNHKDRIRRVKKFQNFLRGDGKNTPEFYDDDVPLLLLGSVNPKALLDEDDEAISEIYGLMQACGSPSVEHDNMLKRSARHSMSLLKYLVCDYVEMEEGERINNTSIEEGGHVPVPLNVFSHAFCSLAIRHYQMLRFELHIREGHTRGAAREEACQVLVLLLTQHYTEDGQSLAPLLLDDLVPQPTAQQAFELWVHSNIKDREILDLMKQNALARQNEIAMKERQDQLANKTLGRISEEIDFAEDDDEDHSDNEDSDGSDSEVDQDDALAMMRKRQKKMQKEMNKAQKKGAFEAVEGPAMRWEDSQLYREQQMRAASSKKAAEAGQHHETVRESQEAMNELAQREEEKAKVLGRDPLGLKGDEFDLRTIQDNQAEYMERTLQALEEGVHKAERENTEDAKKNAEDEFKKQQAQKESLMAIVDRLGGLDQLENPTRSVLPTDPTFDPILFLTMVHREVGYRQLIGSVDRLTNKTTNQHKQLQNLVRENFPLFVRCAEGIDAFNEKTGSQEGPGANERIDRLEKLAENSAHQAKKSFKPLLDNASEVRKVQSSLAVLHRVAPILQAPFLMRQHVENRRYSQALKAYRRVLVIDKNCTIELLNHVKHQAQRYLHETQRDLERCLAQDKVSINDLLNGIRDLGELLELEVRIPNDEEDDDSEPEKLDEFRVSDGVYRIGTTTINIREYPPALVCLLLQAAHFERLVGKAIGDADHIIRRIYGGETLSQVQAGGDGVMGATDVGKGAGDAGTPQNKAAGSNQWKYDVMDARVLAAVKAVELGKNWLPRLLSIGKAATEDEKRRSARSMGSRWQPQTASNLRDAVDLTAFEVFINKVTPSVSRLMEHATFCSLGCPARSGGSELNMSFGDDSPEKLRTLLRGALPLTHGTRVGTELADMVKLLLDSSSDLNGLRAPQDGSYGITPLNESRTLGESAVITLEKRRCIIAFEVCARTCSNRASGSGKLDADALLSTLRTLSEQLTRPEECSMEVENGCELVIQRCCEGLASYVRDRSGDAARLSAVAECADVMENRVTEIIDEVKKLTSNFAGVEEVIMEDIMGLEGAMFDEYLESIRENVANSVRVGWLDMDSEGNAGFQDNAGTSTFPSYLSSSLLSIVRCRAQVEQALGNKIRRADDVAYQHLSMATVADGVVEGICHAVEMRRNKLKVRQADRLANELQFLLNTLRKFLSDGTIAVLDSTRLMLCSKAGRGGGFHGDGPEGLAALESLERLGRVYVMCLGE